MCKSLYEWQGATGINTFVSGQKICPRVRIFIKNEFLSTSPHSFGSFPQKTKMQRCIIAARMPNTRPDQALGASDQASCASADLPAFPALSRRRFKVVAVDPGTWLDLTMGRSRAQPRAGAARPWVEHDGEMRSEKLGTPCAGW